MAKQNQEQKKLGSRLGILTPKLGESHSGAGKDDD